MLRPLALLPPSWTATPATLGFETELGDDAEYRGRFTTVFRLDEDIPSP